MSYIIHSNGQSMGLDGRVRMGGGRNVVSINDPFNGSTYTLVSGGVTPNGLWKAEYANGSGAGVQSASGYTNVFWAQPRTSFSGTGLDSYSCLVLSQNGFNDFDLTLDMRTRSQIRTAFPARKWEAGQIFWRYSDAYHHYYFVMKQDGGCEFGKKDNPNSTDTVQIIYDGPPPSSGGNLWQIVRVRAEGKRHSVYLDGTLIIDTYDSGNSGATAAMAAGKVGMYAQDAFAEWRNLQLVGL